MNPNLRQALLISGACSTIDGATAMPMVSMFGINIERNPAAHFFFPFFGALSTLVAGLIEFALIAQSLWMLSWVLDTKPHNQIVEKHLFFFVAVLPLIGGAYPNILTMILFPSNLSLLLALYPNTTFLVMGSLGALTIRRIYRGEHLLKQTPTKGWARE